jgi:hypothetical protein
MKKIFINAALFLLVLAGSSWAINDQAGTSGAAFLKMGQSVRAASLGGSFVALADDPSAIFYNPSGLLLTTSRQMSFTQTNWLVGSSYSTICFANPVDENSAFGIGFSRVDFGSIQETTATARTGTGQFFSPGSLLVAIAFAKNTPRAFIGGNIKLFRQNISSYQEDGIGFDLGLLSITPIENLRLGASLLNLGWSGDKALPQTFLLGLEYETARGITLLGDFSLQRDSDPLLHLGAELNPSPVLTLRGGMSGSNFSLGIGFKVKKFNLDYAYVPNADLGDTHRAGITVRF